MGNQSVTMGNQSKDGDFFLIDSLKFVTICSIKSAFQKLNRLKKLNSLPFIPPQTPRSLQISIYTFKHFSLSVKNK